MFWANPVNTLLSRGRCASTVGDQRRLLLAVKPTFLTHIGESSMLHLLSFLPVPRKKHLLFFSCKGNEKANLEQDGRNKEICKYNIIEVAVYIYICNIYK